MKKLLSFILVLTLIAAILPVPTLALTEVTDSSSEIKSENPSTVAPCNCILNQQDIYGATGWVSLSAAQAYYGTDFSYTYCGGNPYNYYYTFSDGSRMFFGVKG